MRDPRGIERLVPRETHWGSWDSGSPTLSAGPNDGIHLLFYGHSWSSVAPNWPKAHNLSFPLFPLSLPYSLPLRFFILTFALTPLAYTSIFVVRSPDSVHAIFIHLPSRRSSFTFPSLLCGSLPWCSFYGQQQQAPHMSYSGLMCFKRGWVDVCVCEGGGGWGATWCPYRQTSGQYVTQLPDDLGHSTLQGSHCASSSWGWLHHKSNTSISF